jgi:hypothetical protein
VRLAFERQLPATVAGISTKAGQVGDEIAATILDAPGRTEAMAKSLAKSRSVLGKIGISTDIDEKIQRTAGKIRTSLLTGSPDRRVLSLAARTYEILAGPSAALRLYREIEQRKS